MKKTLKRPLDRYYNPNLYMPFLDYSTFNIVDEKERNLNFKNILKVQELISKSEYGMAMELLSCDNFNELSLILNWINTPRWTESKQELELSNQEKQEINENTKIFDYNKDFDAYYVDFKMFYQIDLISDDLDWFRFNWLLEGLISNETSLIAKRLSYRTYTPKESKNAYKNYMQKQKKLYSLVPENKQKLYDNIREGGGVIGSNSRGNF